MNCYCCSGKTFEECCQPFISSTAKSPTAEALMRSRYSAYATADVEYIISTTHPSTRKVYNREAVEAWARSSRWQKLEIISTDKGCAKDKEGKVEFKAYYFDSENQPQTHHELSNFEKVLGKWFFVDGKNIS